MADERNLPINESSAPPEGDSRDASVGQSGPASEPIAGTAAEAPPDGDPSAESPSSDLRDERPEPREALQPEDTEQPEATEDTTEKTTTQETTTEETTDYGSESSQESVEPRTGSADMPAAVESVAERRPEKKSGGKRAAAEAGETEKPKVEKSDKMDWYILKVQSNREDSIRDGLLRRVAIAGLDYYFGDVIVPTEKVTEFKGGKKRITKRKLYPGYIVVNMEINDDTWFMVRDTPGIGDFTGAAGTPTPMLPHEVNRILSRQEEKTDETPKLKINFSVGDRVKINEGTFENFEGEVDSIDSTNGRVTVMINIFGRSTPVELEYWQIEAI